MNVRRRLFDVTTVSGPVGDERLDQSSFADSGRANDADDDGRCFFRKTVDEGYVKALFFDLRMLA
jgi:hypothetical protein